MFANPAGIAATRRHRLSDRRARVPILECETGHDLGITIRPRQHENVGQDVALTQFVVEPVTAAMSLGVMVIDEDDSKL